MERAHGLVAGQQVVLVRNVNPDNIHLGWRILRVNVDTKEIVRVTPEGVNAVFGSWVLAGKSRFLSVDPADKKKAQWGAMKKMGGSLNNQTSQNNGE